MNLVRCDNYSCKYNKNGFCKLEIINISEDKRCESEGIE
ncbi:DUF1540 domain-containing protein [Brassicibacter mesophilus]